MVLVHTHSIYIDNHRLVFLPVTIPNPIWLLSRLPEWGRSRQMGSGNHALHDIPTSLYIFWAGELNIRHTFSKTIPTLSESNIRIFSPTQSRNFIITNTPPFSLGSGRSACNARVLGGAGANDSLIDWVGFIIQSGWYRLYKILI